MKFTKQVWAARASCSYQVTIRHISCTDGQDEEEHKQMQVAHVITNRGSLETQIWFGLVFWWYLKMTCLGWFWPSFWHKHFRKNSFYKQFWNFCFCFFFLVSEQDAITVKWKQETKTLINMCFSTCISKRKVSLIQISDCKFTKFSFKQTTWDDR